MKIAMSLLEVGPVMFGGTDRIITYLRARNLLAANQDCTRCMPKTCRNNNNMHDDTVMYVQLHARLCGIICNPLLDVLCQWSKEEEMMSQMV